MNYKPGTAHKLHISKYLILLYKLPILKDNDINQLHKNIYASIYVYEWITVLEIYLPASVKPLKNN